MNCWETAQNQIEECRRCEKDNVQYLEVPEKKRHPSFPPPQPTRLLFISVAPPCGGSYFWDDTSSDGLRKGLFEAFNNFNKNEVLKKTGQRISDLSEFREQGFFLVPAVKCPSCEKGKDHRPASEAVKNCAEFLRKECAILSPERILALGKIPMRSVSTAFNIEIPRKVKDFRGTPFYVLLGGRQIPLMGTYFPGNKRHGGFEHIAQDIREILSKSPKPIRQESAAIKF